MKNNTSIFKRLLGFIPLYNYDQSKHRQYTFLYEDLCQ